MSFGTLVDYVELLHDCAGNFLCMRKLENTAPVLHDLLTCAIVVAEGTLHLYLKCKTLARNLRLSVPHSNPMKQKNKKTKTSSIRCQSHSCFTDTVIIISFAGNNH